MSLKSVTEGQTLPLEMQLLNDGAAIDIENMDIELILETEDGNPVDTTDKVENLDDGTDEMRGKVRYSPDAGDLTVADSPYYVQWKVTDGDGKIAFWPVHADRIVVVPQGK